MFFWILYLFRGDVLGKWSLISVIFFPSLLNIIAVLERFIFLIY